MLASLPMARRLDHVPIMAGTDIDGGETRTLGLALKALRQRAGMTLAEAGDACTPTMSGQAWGLYERGEREGIHHPKTQDRLTAAVHASRADLEAERARIAGEDPANENLPLRLATPGVAEGAAAFVVPVITRVRSDPDAQGGLVYDSRHADATIDLGWAFGPTAGRLRMADDRLRGRVFSGQMLHYDRAMPPREGQIAVIETKDGGLHVYEYGEIAGGSVKAQQSNPPAKVEFPMSSVRGVYAVRLIGD